MKKAYICSPYTGKTPEEVKRNIKLAETRSREAYSKGYLPICAHIYLERATGLHEKKGDREELLKLGLEMMLMCDEVWVCSSYASSGMMKEIELAREKHMQIRFL